MSSCVPAVRPKSRSEIDSDATQYLASNFPEQLVTPGRLKVIKCFEQLEDEDRIEVGVEDLEDGTEGLTRPNGKVILSPSTYRGACEGRARDRFTVMHEVAHALFHLDQIRRQLIRTGQVPLCRADKLEAFRNPEWQANTFAGHVLVPTCVLKGFVGDMRRDEAVDAVSDVFGVSTKVAEIRLRQCGLYQFN